MGLLLILSFLVVIGSFQVAKGDLPCQNPLFETHWFCKNDIGTLSDYPMVKTNLRLCPAFNQRKSCCHQSFEAEQVQHFQFWRQLMRSKLERTGKNKQSVLDIEKSVHYSTASQQDLEQYRRALEKFDLVLDPANYADCFSALITYVAGMLCFACESGWEKSVQMDKGKVIRVRIASAVCVELWS